MRTAIAAGVRLGLSLACCACSGSDRDVPVAAAPAAGAGAPNAPSTPGPSAGTSAPLAAQPVAGGGAGGGAVSGSGAASGSGGAAGGAGVGARGSNAGASGDDAPPAPDGGSTAPGLPPVDEVDGDGPFATSQDLATGPGGDSGLFYPTDLGRDGLKHPIFVWGCGGGSQPSSYADHMNRIASHGFVAIAVVSNVGDDGDVLTANLDWLLAENQRPDSLLYGKLDPDSIAAGGHSIGSVNTFLMADDPRLRTTIHVAGGSLDDANDPFAPTTGRGGAGLVHPAALICAESDVFGNTEKSQQDFAAATAPVFLTVIAGADHVGAAREGLAAIVAWLRWHLGGETERSEMFLGPSGEFCAGRYTCQSKNW